MVMNTRLGLTILTFIVMTMTAMAMGARPTPPQPQPSHPAVDGTIAYAALGSDNVTHIYTVSGTAAPIQLTSGSNGDQTPEWSPDGKRITFHRQFSSGPAVYVMDASGGNIKNLSPTPSNDLLPAFSADGQSIVFMHMVSMGTCANPVGIPATTQIMSMSAADGSGRQVVVDGAAVSYCFNAEPQQSPDGQYIAWMCAPLNGGMQVCKINSDGTGFAQITNDAGLVYGDPHWSWDSSKFVVSHLDANHYMNIFTMNADGSGLFQVTHFTTQIGQIGHFGSDPGFSSDSTKIVFEDTTDASGAQTSAASIAVINADGTGYVNLGIHCANTGCGPRFRP